MLMGIGYRGRFCTVQRTFALLPRIATHAYASSPRCQRQWHYISVLVVYVFVVFLLFTNGLITRSQYFVQATSTYVVKLKYFTVSTKSIDRKSVV